MYAHSSSSTPGKGGGPPTEDLVHMVQGRSVRMFEAAVRWLATESESNPNAHQENGRMSCGVLVT